MQTNEEKLRRILEASGEEFFTESESFVDAIGDRLGKQTQYKIIESTVGDYERLGISHDKYLEIQGYADHNPNIFFLVFPFQREEIFKFSPRRLNRKGWVKKEGIFVPYSDADAMYKVNDDGVVEVYVSGHKFILSDPTLH